MTVASARLAIAIVVTSLLCDAACDNSCAIIILVAHSSPQFRSCLCGFFGHAIVLQDSHGLFYSTRSTSSPPDRSSM